jgi:hypothetical protein
MKYPLQIVSMVCFGVAAVCSLFYVLPSTIEHDQLTDHDSFT